jgi:hypothetical protein
VQYGGREIYRWKNAVRGISPHTIVIFYRRAQCPMISDGDMLLLKYKLNNMCDADSRPANGAQRTMIILIYHNILWLSMRNY